MQSLFLLVLLALASSTFASTPYNLAASRILQRSPSYGGSRPSQNGELVARQAAVEDDTDVRAKYQQFLLLALDSQKPESTGCASQCRQIVGSMDNSTSYEAYNRCSCGPDVLVQASNCSGCLGTNWNSAELAYTILCQEMYNGTFASDNVTTSTIVNTGGTTSLRTTPVSLAAVAGSSTLLLLGGLTLLGAA
ncbi:hypothetical protein NBRC10513v2_002157 [Rhodotorula toruloides]